ncbi:MAG: hypothetical protein KDI46_09250 [Alphaproteobacteria bacterium]|nr:hypothetical protein [Alphaproteobacteria bacterium]
MKYVLTALVILLCWPLSAQARPVSYPGGWTFITNNDKDSNAALVHYTLNPKLALGARHEYLRGSQTHVDALQLNWLVKRWNGPDSQANLYIKSGLGTGYKDGDIEPAAFTGLAIDWEDRRYFASYENKFFKAGNLASFAKHSARVGIAPYIGQPGDIHTWLMLQADYSPAKQDDFSLTPLVRFFKGSNLLEAGYNLDNSLLFNYTHRF